MNKINSKKDLVAYLKSAGVSEDVASLVASAMEFIGRGGYIGIKQGKEGTAPYEIQCHQSTKLDSLRGQELKDALSRIEDLYNLLAKTASDSEQEWLRKQIAEITGHWATILINVESPEEFEEKKRLIENAQQLAMNALVRKR